MSESMRQFTLSDSLRSRPNTSHPLFGPRPSGLYTPFPTDRRVPTWKRGREGSKGKPEDEGQKEEEPECLYRRVRGSWRHLWGPEQSVGRTGTVGLWVRTPSPSHRVTGAGNKDDPVQINKNDRGKKDLSDKPKRRTRRITGKI